MNIENRSDFPEGSEFRRIIIEKTNRYENSIEYLIYFSDIPLEDVLNNLKLVTVADINFYIYQKEGDDNIDIIECEECQKIVVEGGNINYEKYPYKGCSGICGEGYNFNSDYGCGKSSCGVCGSVYMCTVCCTFFCYNCEPSSICTFDEHKDFICSRCSV